MFLDNSLPFLLAKKKIFDLGVDFLQSKLQVNKCKELIR